MRRMAQENNQNPPKVKSAQKTTISLLALILALFVGGLPGIIVGIFAIKKEGKNWYNIAAIIFGTAEFAYIIWDLWPAIMSIVTKLQNGDFSLF
jgi:hypothetical protein